MTIDKLDAAHRTLCSSAENSQKISQYPQSPTHFQFTRPMSGKSMQFANST